MSSSDPTDSPVPHGSLAAAAFDPELTATSSCPPSGTAAGRSPTLTYEAANLAKTMDLICGSSLMEMYPSAAATVMRDVYPRTVESGIPLIENEYVYPNDVFAVEVRTYDLQGPSSRTGPTASP